MRKVLVLAMILTMLGGIFAPGEATAQAAGPGPAIGEPVTILSADGSETGTVTVNSLTDPFEDFEAGNDPLRGYHYALLDVTVSNTSARPMTADPAALRVIDSDGFVATSAYLYFEEATAPVFLEYTDALAPGSEVTGAIAYEVFNGAAIQRVIYASGFDTRNTLVDLRESYTAAGTMVPVIGSSGTESAQVTVNGVADPFEGFDESSAPSRGSRYVMIDVTISNTGSRVLTTAPSDFVATDEQGFYLETGFVTPTDPSLVNFDYIDLAPGEEQRGVIYYLVFADIPLGQITYGDQYARDIVVADLAAGAPEPPTPVAQATTAPLVSSPDCEGLVEWGADLIARLTSASALTSPFEGIANEDLDPAAVRAAADQMSVFAQEQRDSIPPPAAEVLNTFMADQFFEIVAEAVGRKADAIEAGDSAAALIADAEIEAAGGAIFEAGSEFTQLYTALTTACPAEVELLDNL